MEGNICCFQSSVSEYPFIFPNRYVFAIRAPLAGCFLLRKSLNYQHGIAISAKAVFLFQRHLIRIHHKFVTTEGSD